MDPITAFQVAGTVVTFVEFSRNLINGAREIYKSPSGTTSQVVKLSTISDDLSNIGDHIMKSLRNSPASSRNLSDATLVKICSRCTVLRKEFQKALRGLEARGDTKFNLATRSIAVAFRSIWSQSEIEDLDRRLREVQAEIQMAVLVSLWEEERIHKRSRQEYLDRNTDAILASVNRTDQKLDQFMKDLLQTSSHQSPEGSAKRSLLFRELWKVDWRPDHVTTNRLEASSSDRISHFIQQDIVNSLWFEAIETRDKAISETYESTYEWILDSNGSTGFVPWMEEDQGLPYWITGKAGSGKSTLMKYLVHHVSTMKHARKWAGGLPLLFCYFYFWGATVEKLQSSQEGLIRTLLWQCLSKNPDLVRTATPRRWTAYQALHGWEGPVPDWSLEELQESFQNLALLNNSSVKLVMFIDGLDEFDGDPATLILWIKDITTKFNIKLCVGSRPWTAFSDAFEQYPTLTMQTLSAQDIQTYIDGQFQTSLAFRDWQALSPDGTEALRQDLFEKADGVFLWVYIVVRELMSALQRGRNIDDLSTILNSLPTDIMNLYTKIYGGADPEEAERAAVYFSLLQNAVHKLTSYELWYIEESTTVDPNDGPASLSMQRVIKRRLDSSTRGMVEVSEKELVVFHHRSVHEWLLLPEVLPILLSHLPEHFDARLLLMKGRRATLARVLQVNESRSTTSSTNQLVDSRTALYYILYYASQVPESPILTSALLRELEAARDNFDQSPEASKKGREGTLQGKFNSIISQRLKHVPPTHTQNRERPQQTSAEIIKIDTYKTLHWTLTSDDSRMTAQSCFTALAARFAVFPYVMAQLKKSPNLLKEKDDRISLLHSAIFGPQLHSDFHGPPLVDHRLRLRLIDALLTSGASVRGRIHFPYTEFDGDDVYYLRAIYGTSNRRLTEVGPKEYWDEVRRLLIVKRSKGVRFRQSLNAKLDMISR